MRGSVEMLCWVGGVVVLLIGVLRWHAHLRWDPHLRDSPERRWIAIRRETRGNFRD
jgi:hypothetical protein